MDGECSTNGRREKFVKNLVGIPEGKRPLGRPRRRWDGDVSMDLREIWWDVQ